MEQKKNRMAPVPSPINQNYKVLVGTPTSDSKDYCKDEFMGRAKNLSYKKYDIVIVDNSKDSNNYKLFSKDNRINAIYVKPKNKPIQTVIAESHEAIRQYFLRGKYDYLLHLESDVIPPQDVIERLMIHNLPIVSAMYFIDFGHNSSLMAQQMEDFGERRETVNLKDGADLNMVDGKLHEVFGHGLGCCLIRRDVLEQISFRWEPSAIFPDSFFAYDCDAIGFKKYIDTSTLCKHLNESWTNNLLK